MGQRDREGEGEGKGEATRDSESSVSEGQVGGEGEGQEQGEDTSCQRQREEREREGELLRQTGTLRLLQVYSERLRSSEAGCINTLLKRGPLGYLEGHEAAGIPERERSPRAGA